MDSNPYSRCIANTGAPNLRDLGGYAARDGRTVKWGMMFRSDDLNDLTDDDVTVLEKLGVRTVVDFRTAHESESWPDRLPTTARRSINIPIDAGRIIGRIRESDLDIRKTTGIMISVYRDLAGRHQNAFKQFFAILSEPARLPLLFHCTAGKDRTGFAAALFLTALGVDRETVMDDYLFSGECLKKRYTPGVDYVEALTPLYQVAPEFLMAAFEVIDHQYGGPEEYLRNQMDVDCEKLRGIFLEQEA